MAEEEATRLHPLLRELDFASGERCEGHLSPLQVLNSLLETKAISDADLRGAVETLSKDRGCDESNANGSPPEDPAKSTEKEPQLEGITTKRVGAKNPASEAAPAPRTRHIALRFIYDGSGFGGLAQNVGLETDNSVEKALFRALEKSKLVDSRASCGYSRCGRTDRGVSAAGQVVAMRLRSAIPADATLDGAGLTAVPEDSLPKNEFERLEVYVVPRKRKQKSKAPPPGNGDNQRQQRVRKELSEYPYAKMMNNLLPATIRVVGWAPVSPDFSARFSASTRRYRYFFVRRHSTDGSRIQMALNRLVGRHDFRNFCKMDVEKVYNFERLIHSAKVVELSDPIHFLEIEGQAFLWHQIRCIAAVAFMVGDGLEEPCVVSEMLDVGQNPGKPNYQPASEYPLVLHDCGYDNLRVGYSVQNLWTVSCQMERRWEELVLAAARERNGIESLMERPVLRADLVEFAASKVAERRKKRRRTGLQPIACDGGNDDGASDPPLDEESPATVKWSDAVAWLRTRGLVPDAVGLDTTVHVRMMDRSRGTTYEQKLESLKNSDRRRRRFEENVVKKRKTAEEDGAFYAHMTKQGGAGI